MNSTMGYRLELELITGLWYVLQYLTKSQLTLQLQKEETLNLKGKSSTLPKLATCCTKSMLHHTRLWWQKHLFVEILNTLDNTFTEDLVANMCLSMDSKQCFRSSAVFRQSTSLRSRSLASDNNATSRRCWFCLAKSLVATAEL